MNDSKKRDAAVLVMVITFTTILLGLVIWLVIEMLFPPDPRDPLTKAGELKPTQDIRKVR
jgi:hypothetical protein